MAVSNPATLSSVISEAAASGLGTYDSLYDFRRNGPVLGDSETTIGYGTEASPLKLSQFNGFEFVQYFWANGVTSSGGTPMTVDQNGKIHAAVQTGSPTQYYHYAVTKNGAAEWAKSVESSFITYDLKFDGSSAVYATGGYQGTASSGSSVVFFSKRDTNGSRSFLKAIDPVSSDVDYYPSIAASTSNIYLCMHARNSNSLSSLRIAKYNSSGTLQWARSFSGESISGTDVCIDSSENQYYIGTDTSAATSANWKGSLYKVNSSGTLQWQKLLSTYIIPRQCVYNNAEGALYVVGYSGSSSTGYLFKLDTNGAITWQRQVNVSLYSVHLGSDGYIYVGGTGSSVEKGSVIKFDTSANIIWQREFTVSARVGLDSYGSVATTSVKVSGTSLYMLMVYGFSSTKGSTYYPVLIKLPTDGSRTGGLWNAASYSWSVSSITLSNSARSLSAITPALNTDITTADVNQSLTITKNSL